MKKNLFSLFIFVLIAYVAACVYLFTMQESLIFPGAYKEASSIQKHAPLSNNIKQISLTTKDGVQLDGALAQNSSKTLLIYFSGNSENALNLLNTLGQIPIVDSITFHYRGYVSSQGEPTANAILSDALEIFDTYKSKYENIILLGRSLGTGVAAYVASQREVLGTLLVTPYDSILNVAQDQYPFMPIKFLLNNDIDSLKYMQNIPTPLGLLLVENDLTIPNKNSYALKEKISNLIDLKVVSNTTHNNIIKTNEFKQFIRYNIDTLIKGNGLENKN